MLCMSCHEMYTDFIYFFINMWHICKQISLIKGFLYAYMDSDVQALGDIGSHPS